MIFVHLSVLPSQVHPSYPYGNPTNIRHPASRPRIYYNSASRALFEDFRGGGVNGSLTWKDLALDRLLPVDREKEENERRRLEEEMQQHEATKKLSSIEERQMEEEEAGPAPAIGKRKREPEVTVGTSRKSARIAGRKPRRGAS